MLTSSHPILIVGAGPTGLVAANLLGLYGIPTVLIEKNKSVIRDPRSTFVDDECLRLLSTIGLTDKLSNQVFGPITFERYSPLGFLLSREEGMITDHNYPTRSALYQPWFDQTLADGLTRFNCVETIFNCELIHINNDPESQSVQVTYKHNNEEEITRDFAYVLGCDGHRSKVRELLNIDFVPVTPHENRSIRIDVEGTNDTSLVMRSGHDLTRMWAIFPAPNGRRFSFSVVKGENPDDLLTDEAALNLIKPFVTEEEFSNLRIVFRSHYTFRSRLASSFYKHRVFLLGDAAHTMPPAGSQGLNSGVRDANSLCWKIAYVYKGLMKPSLLDFYEQERMPALKQIIEQVSNEYNAPRQRTKQEIIEDDLKKFCQLNTDSIINMTSQTSGLKKSDSKIFWSTNYKKLSHVTTGRSSFVQTGMVYKTNDDNCPQNQYIGRVISNPWIDINGQNGTLLDDLLGCQFCLVYCGISENKLNHPFWEKLSVKQISITKQQSGPNKVSDHRLDTYWKNIEGYVLLVRPDRVIASICKPEDLDKCADMFYTCFLN